MANDLASDTLEQLPALPAPKPVQTPTPAPAADPRAEDYAAMFAEQDGGRKQQLRVSLAQTTDQAPDRAADVLRLSRQTGIAADIVSRHYDDVRKQATVDHAPLTEMVRDTPALATWAADPANAAVSHDDMDKLGALEWLVTMPSRAISQSLNEQAYGQLRAASIFRPLTQEETDRLNAYKLHAQMGGELGSGNSWMKGALTKTMKLLTTLTAPQAIPTVSGAIVGAGIGAAGGALIGGVGAIPGAVAGAKVGAEAGYTYGLGASAFQTAAASSYDEYLELTDAVGRKLDPEVAKALAVTNGAINAGLMVFGGRAIAAGMETGGKAIGAQLTKNAIKEAIRQPSVVGAIAAMVKSYGVTLTEGTALMVAMKTGDILTHALASASGQRTQIAGQQEPGNVDLFKQPAVQNPDGSVSTVDSFSVNIDGQEVLLPTVTPDGRHLEQDAAVAEYTKTGRHLGKFDSPQAATAFAKQLHEDYAAGHYTQPTIGQQLLRAAAEGVQSFAIIGLAGPARGLAHEFGRAKRAEQGVTFFKALGEGVEQSATAKRLPEAAQAFLEKATKDGPIPTLYTSVSDWTKYWQDREIDPAAMAAELTGVPDAYEQAMKTGEDLAIPTARYATRLAATEHNTHFADELRLGPEEMNGRESKALIESMQTTPDAGAPPETGTPVYRAALEQLTQGGGLSQDTAAQYAGLVDAAFGSMAQRAGVDPLELYREYGLTVGRPDVPGEGQTPAPAGEAGAATQTALPADQMNPDPADAFRRAEMAARTAGVQGAAADLVSRPSDRPIPVMADVIAAARAMKAENPTIEADAQAMRDKALKAGRIPEPTGRGVVDNKADAAQNPENYFNADRPSDTRPAATAEKGAGPGDATGQQPRADEARTVEGRGYGGGAQPGGTPAGIPALDEVFTRQPQAHTDARITPEVERELRRIVDELQRDGFGASYWDWSPTYEHGKTGNAGGGGANKRGGHAGAPVYVDVLAHSPMNLVTSGRAKGEPARRAHGDRAVVEAAIVKLLETRHATNNLMEGALRVAENRNAGIWRDLSRPTLPPSWGEPVTREFTDQLSTAIDEAAKPADLLNASGFEQDAVETGDAGDTSFDFKEFNQSLFDDIAPPDPTTDTLTTGEQQNRLPGDVGAVREQDVKAPEFDLPFALTHEIAKPKAAGKRTDAPLSPEYLAAKESADTASAAFRDATKLYRDKQIDDATYLEARRLHDEASAAFDTAFAKEQRRSSTTTLFQGPLPALTKENVAAWAQEVKDRVGPDLVNFSVFLTSQGDLQLDTISIARGAMRAGLGSSVMRELTRFADLNGRRIILSPADRGYSPDPAAGVTTSYGRLVKFYKRFGFEANRGRHTDYSVSAGMIREPNAIPGRELGQPLFHGSPHDFEKFSLQHVGTGEGAAAYGWGLYFAENPAVAADYHDRLSEGRDVVKMKLGTLSIKEPHFDYTRRAHENSIENIRASLAEDLLGDPLALNAAGEAGFQKHVLELLDRKIADYKLSGEYQEGVDAAELLKKELSKPGAVGVEFTKTTGGVYQVDIPDEHLERMIDWDAPIKDQPQAVKRFVREFLQEQGYLNAKDDGPRQLSTAFKSYTMERGGFSSRDNGEMVYSLAIDKAAYDLARAAGLTGKPGAEGMKAIEQMKGDPDIEKLASRKLHEAGVPGLRYLDQGSRDTGKGTRNVVVFDDSIVTLTHKDGKPFTPAERKEYFQGNGEQQQPKRGVIRFGPDRQFNIDLLERADLSTFLHESGHFFLEVFGDLADKVSALPLEQLTEEQRHLLSDYGTTLQALGVERRGDVGTAQHEAFARMFEAYLREGKAPSLALQTPFARFRAWLLSIYSSLQKLNIKLTPEVSGVFDRMLASDHAIAEAEQQRGVGQMFLTAADAGMDAKEFELYTRTVRDAHQEAAQRLDEKLMRDVFREQTRAWKEQRAEIRTAVEGQVHERPEYRAIAAMKAGEHPNGEPLVEGLTTPPLQLSRAILDERFGAERAKRLPRGIVAGEGGLDPDLVAEMFGYSSADAMLTAVEKAPSMRQVIEQETKRQMLEQHGSILLDGSLAPKAQAAVANETRDEVIRAEMRALGRLRRTVDPFVKAERAAGRATLEQERAEREYERRWFEAEAKLRIAVAEGHKQVEIDELTRQVRELKAQARGGAAVIRAAIPDAATLKAAAETRIAGMRIGDIQPATFWSASRRAGQQALDKAARQDFDGAITAKQQELLNLALYREAENAKADAEDRARFAQGLTRPAMRATIGKAGQSYLEQVDGILDRYEFATVSKKTLARRSSILDWVEAQKAQGLPVDGLPAEVLNDARRINWRQVTVSELTGITDGLKQILHIARLKNKLLRAADQREFSAVRDGLVDTIRTNTAARPKMLEFRPSDQRKRTAADFFASHRKISSLIQRLDGHVDGGPMWDAIMRPINDAGHLEETRRTQAGTAYMAILEKHYPGRELGRLNEKIEIPAIGGSLSLEGRIAVGQLWGTETGRERLTHDPTRGWNESQVQAILDTLSKRDWDFIADHWKYLDSFWPEIAAKQERVTGLAPEKVDPLPVSTKFGDYPGGYSPIAYESRLSIRAGQNEAASQAKLSTYSAYVQNTTKRGFIQERVAHTGLPVRLEMSVGFQHIDEVLHDLTHHEMLIDVTRLLRDSKVSQAIMDTAGDLVYQQLTRGVQDIAIGSTPAARNMLDKSANFLKQRTQLAMLGLNLWTGLQQPLGVFNGMDRVGVKWVAKGMGRWLRDAASMENTTKWIADVSPMMRERVTSGTQDLHDLRVAFNKPGGWFDTMIRTVTADHLTKQTIIDGYLWHIGIAQRVADVPTWLGMYEKQMAAGVNEPKAIALADQAVLDSQGGGQVKDLAQIQRGGPVARLFTTFYSYGNTVLNATARDAERTNFKSPTDVATFLGHLSLLYVLPALGSATLAGVSGRKTMTTVDDFIKTAGSEVLASAMNTLVFVRELGGAAQLALGMDTGARGYGGPAALRPFETAYKLAQEVHQGKLDEGLWHAANAAAGVLYRYPSAQLQRTVDGWVALQEGRTTNPAALLVGPPKKK